MKIIRTEVNQFPLFDDFREVLDALKLPEGTHFTFRGMDDCEVMFERDEWHWFLKAAEKGWKLL